MSHSAQHPSPIPERALAPTLAVRPLTGAATGAAKKAARQCMDGVSKTRGRPRSFDTGQAIVLASTLFRQRGYDRVTLSDLTGVMGINPPSFYAAFGSKALLFKSVSDAYLEDWLKEIRAAFENSPSLADALRQIIMAAASRFAWQADSEDIGKTIGRAAGQGGCLILESANNCSDALVCAHIRKARLTVAAALYRGISHDAPDDVVALTDHVMMLLAGLSAMARDGVAADRLVPMADHAANALCPVPTP